MNEHKKAAIIAFLLIISVFTAYTSIYAEAGDVHIKKAIKLNESSR